MRVLKTQKAKRAPLATKTFQALKNSVRTCAAALGAVSRKQSASESGNRSNIASLVSNISLAPKHLADIGERLVIVGGSGFQNCRRKLEMVHWFPMNLAPKVGHFHHFRMPRFPPVSSRSASSPLAPPAMAPCV